MSVVYWDTMLFVYLLEDNERYAGRVQAIASGMERRGDVLCTSVFTLAEVLLGPVKRGERALAARIRGAMREPFVRLLPFTEEAAERYAYVRAELGVTAADAIHLASAAAARADLFLTNDQRLVGRRVEGIQFVAGLDLNLY